MPPRKNPANPPKTPKSVQKVKMQKPPPLKIPKIIKVKIPIPRLNKAIPQLDDNTDPDNTDPASAELSAPAPIRGRPRGRPRKNPVNVENEKSKETILEAPTPIRGRPRGRPKKTPDNVDSEKSKEIILEETILNSRNITPLAKLVAEAESAKSPTLKNKLQIIDNANEVANCQLVKNAVLRTQEETPLQPRTKRTPRKAVVSTETNDKTVNGKKNTGNTANGKKTRDAARAATKTAHKRLTRTIINTEAVTKTTAEEVTKATPTQKPEEKPGPRLRNKNKIGKSENVQNEDIPASETAPNKTSPNKKVTGKRSMSSNSDKSSLNWAKDISSSAYSYVSVNGNVYIDGKSPVLRIKPINLAEERSNEIDAETHLSDSDSSDSSSTSSSSVSEESENCTSVNLSYSSLTPKSPIQTHSHSNSQSKENKSLKIQMLKDSLKDLDSEFADWVSFKPDETVNSKKIKKKIFDEWKLKEESDILTHCQALKQLFDNSSSHKEIDSQKEVDSVDEEAHFPVPSYKPPEVAGDDPDITSPRSDRFRQSRDNYDDDDALSLFAESITGLESVKTTPDNQYIPKPIKSINSKFDYQPTKISDLVQNAPVNVDKHNADSASILKELEKEDVLDYEPLEVFSKPTEKVQMPHYGYHCMRLMSSLYAPPHGPQSKTFARVCFFNLIGNCKKAACHFPHRKVQAEEIRNSLKTLTTPKFVSEYLLLRKWPMLFRKYGLVYIEECMTRGLTRYLIEMSIDFCNKANNNSKEDDAQKFIVLESVLMYLNAADLSDSIDILQFKMYDGKQICDVYIETIANGQNFSRFKLAFIKLTKIMVGIHRHFNIHDVSHILERICILPYEEQLSKAMINIILNTDLAIFDNSMTNYFESQLESFNKDLHDKFTISKKQKMELVAEKISIVDTRRNFVESPMFAEEHMGNPMENPYTSPDTTAIDNMNKPTEEPMESLTVDLHKLQFRVNNTSPLSSEEFWPRPPSKRSWAPVGMRGRGRGYGFSPPDLIRGIPIRGDLRDVPRGFKRCRDMHTLYGRPRAKFVRHSGPKF